jgi:hypothetical protein
MGTQRKIIQMLSSIGIIMVGVYMFTNHAWPTPPAVSGVGFFLTGLALWMNHCPVLKYFFEKK